MTQCPASVPSTGERLVPVGGWGAGGVRDPGGSVSAFPEDLVSPFAKVP